MLITPVSTVPVDGGGCRNFLSLGPEGVFIWLSPAPVSLFEPNRMSPVLFPSKHTSEIYVWYMSDIH